MSTPATVRPNLAQRFLEFRLALPATGALEATAFGRFFSYAFQPIYVLTWMWITAFYASPENMVFLLSCGVIPLLILERIFPWREDWRPTVKQTFVEVAAYYVIASMVLGPIIGGFVGKPMNAAFEFARGALGIQGIWPHSWPVLARIMLAWLISDLVWYWVHRAQHEVGKLWYYSGHVTHHSPKRLSALTTYVNHPIEFPFILISFAVLAAFLGAGPQEIIAVQILGTIQNNTVHLNLRLRPLFPFKYLITSSQYHVRHHSPYKEENNSNYGCTLIIWDRLFGTFVDEARYYDTGIAKRELTLLEQLILPIWVPTGLGELKTALPVPSVPSVGLPTLAVGGAGEAASGVPRDSAAHPSDQPRS